MRVQTLYLLSEVDTDMDGHRFATILCRCFYTTLIKKSQIQTFSKEIKNTEILQKHQRKGSQGYWLQLWWFQETSSRCCGDDDVSYMTDQHTGDLTDSFHHATFPFQSECPLKQNRHIDRFFPFHIVKTSTFSCTEHYLNNSSTNLRKMSIFPITSSCSLHRCSFTSSHKRPLTTSCFTWIVCRKEMGQIFIYCWIIWLVQSNSPLLTLLTNFHFTALKHDQTDWTVLGKKNKTIIHSLSDRLVHCYGT